MSRHKSLRLTPVYLYTDDYRPGPCYVLDPEAWEWGVRVVLEILPALPEKHTRRRSRPSERPVRATQERRVVTWPQGRPTEWHDAYVPVRQPEPAWAARARELRTAGWSERRIMEELGVRSKRQLREILYG